MKMDGFDFGKIDLIMNKLLKHWDRYGQYFDTIIAYDQWMTYHMYTEPV